MSRRLKVLTREQMLRKHRIAIYTCTGLVARSLPPRCCWKFRDLYCFRFRIQQPFVIRVVKRTFRRVADVALRGTATFRKAIRTGAHRNPSISRRVPRRQPNFVIVFSWSVGLNRQHTHTHLRVSHCSSQCFLLREVTASEMASVPT